MVMPRAPSPTFEDLAPAPRSRLWLAGALTAAAAATIVAALLMASKPERDRVEPSPATDDPAAGPVMAPTLTPAPSPDPARSPTPAPNVASSGLDLSVSPRSSRIRIDGVEFTGDRGQLARSLAPGRYQLAVDARGHRPVRRNIEITGGATLQLEVRLDPIESRPPPRSAPRPRAEAINPDGTIDPFE